jgi:hypothetical protein
MTISFRVGVGIVFLGALAVAAWMRMELVDRLRSFEARANEFAVAPIAGAGPGRSIRNGSDALPDSPVVVVARPAPPTIQQARVWEALQKSVDLPFPAETTLDDILKYIKDSTKSQDLSEGLPIYVDPAGLLEAEKTMQSPVTIDLRGVPLRTGLDLVLRQLDLAWSVHPDGFLAITYVDSQERSFFEGRPSPDADPQAEIAALRAAVATLHGELQRERQASSGMSGMGLFNGCTFR